MAKKKKNISGVMRKKSIPVVSVNKFELKINKQKNKVLGQRPSKHDKGMPGFSKSKSIKKRMETLLVDYQKSKRVNSFKDKRIENKGVSEEEKALNRFKLKHKNSAKLYNLDDDEEEDEDEITHRGTKISQLTTFDAPILSDDDNDRDSDEEDVRKRDRNVTSRYTEENFGGGVLQRLRHEDGSEVSHKDRMAELVFQSIVEKNQRRKEKDQLQDKIEDLNSKMKSVLPLLSAHVNRGDIAKSKPDSLDVAVRMLGMMPRGTPSEKVKSKEEVEKEEKERLRKEEEERRERMKDPGTKRQLQHVSADAHADDEWLETKRKKKFEVEDEDEEDEESEDDDDEGSECDDDEGSEDDDDEADEESYDKDDDDEKDDVDHDDDGKVEKKEEGLSKSSKGESLAGRGIGVKVFVESVKGQSYLLRDVASLQSLDAMTLLQFLQDRMQAGPTAVWQDLETCCKILWRMARKDPLEAANAFRHFIFDAQADFQVRCDSKNYGSMPSSPFTYALLHLVSHLFPTSDYHHAVCTPFFIAISHFLAMSRVGSNFDIAAGLYLSNLLIKGCLDDKRWMPEALNFVHTCLLLHCCKPLEYKKKNKRTKVKDFDFLRPAKEYSAYEGKFRVRDMFEEREDSFIASDEFKMESLGLSLQNLLLSMALHKGTPAFRVLFQHHVDVMQAVPWPHYPPEIEALSGDVSRCFEEGCSEALRRLRGQQVRPKGITFLEPLLLDKSGGKAKNAETRDYEERKRLARKEKRKGKDDLRQVKKNQAFMNEHILAEKISKNKEREEKTRRILNDLAEQEGWYKQANKKKSTALPLLDDKKKEKIKKF